MLVPGRVTIIDVKAANDIVKNLVTADLLRKVFAYKIARPEAPLHQTLAEIRLQESDAIKNVADYWVLCALAERDIAAAESALVALGDNYLGIDAVRLRRSFGEGLVARMKKDEAGALAAFTRARAEQGKLVQEQPNYGPAVCVLGLIDAAFGPQGRGVARRSPRHRVAASQDRFAQWRAYDSVFRDDRRVGR